MDKEFPYTIESEGAIQREYKWNHIICTVIVDRESEKAIHGTIYVREKNSNGFGNLHGPIINWLPKSMANNPWFICTNIFEEENKISNRRY